MDWLLKNWETIIAMIVGPALTWFLIKKPFQKRDLEAKDLENDVSQTSLVGQNLALYQRMLEDIEIRYEAKFKKLDKEIFHLEEENKTLKERIKELESKYNLEQ